MANSSEMRWQQRSDSFGKALRQLDQPGRIHRPGAGRPGPELRIHYGTSLEDLPFYGDQDAARDPSHGV